MLKTLLANAYYYSLLLLSFTLTFPRIISNILIIILGIIWLSSSSLQNKVSYFRKNKIGALFISVFFLYCVGLIYSENVKSGLFEIEKILTILIFPLIILSTPQLSASQFKNILKAFVVGILIASVIGITYAIYRRFIIKSLSAFEINNFYIEIPHIFMTHVYFGIYLVLAIYFTIYLYLNNRNHSITETIATIFIICFLSTLVFTSGSFMSFISLFVSIIIFITLYLRRNYSKIYVVAALLLLIGSFSLLAFSGHSSINRYKQRIFLSFKHVENDQYNYSSTRVGPLLVGLDVAKEHWLWGVGTGDTEDIMKEQYIRKNLDNLAYLNTHNQYLDFLIAFGIFGLCLYLICLLYPLYLSLKKQFYLYTFFLILFLLTGGTENILATNKGIVLYSLFNALLAQQLYTNKKTNQQKINLTLG